MASGEDMADLVLGGIRHGERRGGGRSRSRRGDVADTWLDGRHTARRACRSGDTAADLRE